MTLHHKYKCLVSVYREKIQILSDIKSAAKKRLQQKYKAKDTN